MKIKANLLNKPVNFQLYRTKENGLLVSQYKTKSSTRTVSLPPPLLNILKEYMDVPLASQGGLTSGPGLY